MQALLLVLLLAGCSADVLIPSSTPMPAGVAADAPVGWIDYCRRTPEDTGCPSP